MRTSKHVATCGHEIDGGLCFSKDVKQLVEIAKEIGAEDVKK